MRLAVLKERRASETRVAATPETVKRLVGLGLTVAVEAEDVPTQRARAAGLHLVPVAEHVHARQPLAVVQFAAAEDGDERGLTRVAVAQGSGDFP